MRNTVLLGDAVFGPENLGQQTRGVDLCRRNTALGRRIWAERLGARLERDANEAVVEIQIGRIVIGPGGISGVIGDFIRGDSSINLSEAIDDEIVEFAFGNKIQQTSTAGSNQLVVFLLERRRNLADRGVINDSGRCGTPVLVSRVVGSVRLKCLIRALDVAHLVGA